MEKPLIYLFVGSEGRLGSHLVHYFKSLSFKNLSGLSPKIEVLTWARKKSDSPQPTSDHTQKLLSLAEQATHIWLCLPDRYITEYHKLIKFHLLEKNLSLPIFIHSSGAWSYPEIYSAHPLMSFRPLDHEHGPYPESIYQKINFALTSPAQENHLENSWPKSEAAEIAQNIKKKLFPFLPNFVFYLPEEHKAFYHALCVLAGNGSVLLWQKFFKEMPTLGCSVEGLEVFARQISENFLTDPESALTGPLVRKDTSTLALDAAALKADPFFDVFQALTRLKATRPGPNTAKAIPAPQTIKKHSAGTSIKANKSKPHQVT
jgi:hypothetical protein